MRRRTFFKTAGALSLGALTWAGHHYWPREGLVNPCLPGPLPGRWANHPLVQHAWEGIDPNRYLDTHVHLLALGDEGSGAWINPAMTRWSHPGRYLQYRFYLNAACVDPRGAHPDRSFLDRLNTQLEAFPAAARALLLAFDYHYTPDGQRDLPHSTFYIPNRYAAQVAARYPERLDWAASIHPWRHDALEALERAAEQGARAVKWLPPAQGIDPASAHCDDFYRGLVRHGLPLIVHAGQEAAVQGEGYQALANPLRLRRPLEQGVTVIIAHCASLGQGDDLDHPGAKARPNFELFTRLMDEPDYRGHLFGEISALPQINRMGEPLTTVLRRQDWHHRLVNGSDYPLPGVMPLFSLQALVDQACLSDEEARVLAEIRRYNPLLFDFVCKRSLDLDGHRLSPQVFMDFPDQAGREIRKETAYRG